MFLNKFRKKKANKKNEEINNPEYEGYFRNGKPIIPQDEIEMSQAESQFAERQVYELSERPQPPPETEEELVSKFFDVESKGAVSRKLIRVKDPKTNIEIEKAIEEADEYPEMFNSDIPKSDLLPEEIQSCWGNLTLINLMRTIGKSKKFSLAQVTEFNNNQKNMIINLSRGRFGFSVKMSRTTKAVSEGTIEYSKKMQENKKENNWRSF